MPTATVCTTEFAPLAQAEARSLGMRSLPLIVIPHPMGDLNPEEVCRRADAALDEIVRALTRPARELTEEFSDKTYAAPKTAFKSKPLFE